MINVAELSILFRKYTHQNTFQVYSSLRRNAILSATIITLGICHHDRYIAEPLQPQTQNQQV